MKIQSLCALALSAVFLAAVPISAQDRGPFDILITGGHVVVEIGFALEEGVRELFGKGWELLPTRTDLQGIPRVIAARKR